MGLFAEMLARFAGADGHDDLALIDADIAADNQLLTECQTKRDWLKSQLAASELDGDLETAERIDEELRLLDRTERGARARLPHLEDRRKVALDIKRKEAIAVATEQNRAAYVAVRAAVMNLASANSSAIALTEELRARFGERDAALHFPRAMFVGIPLADLVALWAQDSDRVFGLSNQAASPQPRPIPPSAPKPRAVLTTSDANRTVSLNDAPTIAPKSNRKPLPANVEGGVQITFLRGGIELGNGAQSVAGDVLVVEPELADCLMRTGAADKTEAAHV